MRSLASIIVVVFLCLTLRPTPPIAAKPPAEMVITVEEDAFTSGPRRHRSLPRRKLHKDEGDQIAIIGGMNVGIRAHNEREAEEKRNEAFISTTGEPYMYACEGELIHVRFDTPYANGPLTWTAEGLPVGLSINAKTGVISGRPQYDQAGGHPVNLTAKSQRGDAYTVSFSWKVRDTNRWEWLDDQYHRVGESVKIRFRANDEIGNVLKYKFDNLPPGVTFDEKFGFVGKIKPGGDGPHKVTAYVSGGNAKDQFTFNWGVFRETAAAAAFAINDTFVHSDDVGLVGRPKSVWVKYFLGPDDRGPIKIEVTSGASVVSAKENDPVESTSVIFQLTDWPIGWLHLYWTGKAPSTGTDDHVITAFHWVKGKWAKME